ncbi:MAG TPA: ABC transporter substrate-binding protein [Roseiarcus sp.]|jgi:branched-chain amino acid transport system substrate-binding protein
MKSPRRTLMLAGALSALFAASAASAAADKVVIGDIDDMSGPYADVIGAGGVEALKMAIADFGGSVLGQPIQILTYDHQNKPDLGAQKLREWADTDGMTLLLGGSNTGVSLAMSAAAKEKKIPFIAIGAAGGSLTGKDCSPYTIHYGYDTTALANGTAKTIVEGGGKSWFFLTADYAFGKQLEAAATDVVKANGGTVVGDVRVPLGTSDFSSYLLQAQGSGAQVLALANAGADTSNSLKAAAEFGLTKSMKPAALLVFITDVHAVGLDIAQGLVLTTAWYWNTNDETRAFANRFFEKTKKMPTFNQAAYYSATMTYLNAVKAVGTTDSDKVMEQLHKTRVNDMFVKDAPIRPDGLLEHDMYVVQVKTPAESKGDWDFYKILKTMKGEEAFGKLADSACPLVKK